MPRRPRIDLSGYHHVLNRGVNRENIFLSKEDKETFLHILDQVRDIYHIKVHAYCVLDNHYHLLIETSRSNLSLAVRYLNSQYANYFNKKMQRVGPLWQGRFKSWYVHDDSFFWLLLRYIEMNPVKAGICETIGDYEFSSSYQLVHSCQTDLLRSSALFTTDIHDWLVPLSPGDSAELQKFEEKKMEKKGDRFIPEKTIPLSNYFAAVTHVNERNFAIYQATADGWRQAEVARYLNLSPVAISRIVAAERAKRDLFNATKERGLFWSYAATIEYTENKSTLLIETVLKYSDIDDIRLILLLFGKRKVRQVWEAGLANDARFKKLNYFLARVLFKLDVEAEHFAEIKQSRADKLRLLAG
jgi:REP element-mobilizing transposase RayT/transcriptional regulator with XRE-family HTH domain